MLRDEIIKLAHEVPKLRAHLVPLLRTAGSTLWVSCPPGGADCIYVMEMGGLTPQNVSAARAEFKRVTSEEPVWFRDSQKLRGFAAPGPVPGRGSVPRKPPAVATFLRATLLRDRPGKPGAEGYARLDGLFYWVSPKSRKISDIQGSLGVLEGLRDQMVPILQRHGMSPRTVPWFTPHWDTDKLGLEIQTTVTAQSDLGDVQAALDELAVFQGMDVGRALEELRSLQEARAERTRKEIERLQREEELSRYTAQREKAYRDAGVLKVTEKEVPIRSPDRPSRLLMYRLFEGTAIPVPGMEIDIPALQKLEARGKDVSEFRRDPDGTVHFKIIYDTTG